jgi:hypothetical protein
MREVCEILFGERADEKLAEYLASHPVPSAT